MRNQPKPLSYDERSHQSRMRDILAVQEGPVTVEYVKRDGSVSTSTGKVAFFNGVPGMDTGSVTIETEDKGPRTINLHRITVIK